MAKYDDYVTQGIDGEINDAAANQQARDEQGRFIPERFKGKDITDVIKSYEELEKMNSRQSQDLGEMRRTVDQLLELQTASSPVEDTSIPLSADDLYADPDAAVRRVVKEESSNEIRTLREEVDQLRNDKVMSELDKRFPDWQTKSNSSEFLEWAEQSPYRLRIAQDAAKGNFDAAEEILGLYYDTEVQAKADDKPTQDHRQNLADAMLETGSPAPVEMVDTFSRNELLEVRMAAKHGDLKAERWLAAHGESIANAYAEGRIVD